MNFEKMKDLVSEKKNDIAFNLKELNILGESIYSKYGIKKEDIEKALKQKEIEINELREKEKILLEKATFLLNKMMSWEN